jgi:CheY-like chemotaxis protein
MRTRKPGGGNSGEAVAAESADEARQIIAEEELLRVLFLLPQGLPAGLPDCTGNEREGASKLGTMISITSNQRVSDLVAELASKPVLLVVEDELLVRILQVDILREAGFRVAEAENADEAFDMLRSRSEIVAVLTDVNMPGSLNGFEFAQLVKQGWPEVGVLVISGKTQPGPRDLPVGVEFVLKPVRPAALVERIRALVPAAHPTDQGQRTVGDEH